MSAARQEEAEQLAAQLTEFVNVMSSRSVAALADALGNQHPTLVGQVARSVAQGILSLCGEGACQWTHDGTGFHKAHDERFECTTVYGAQLMARQPLR